MSISLFRSPLAILFLTVFLDLVGFGLVLPILPNISRELGAEPWLVGFTASIFSIMQFVFGPIWGSLSDRYGRRPLLLISIGINALAYALFGFSSTLLILMTARALAGIGSANLGVAQAYITDVTDVRSRAKAMGLIGAAFGLGFIFGPPIGGLLKKYFDLIGVGMFAAGLCTLNLVLAWFFLPESLKEPKHDSKVELFKFDYLFELVQRPMLGRMFLLYFLLVFAFATQMMVNALLWKDHYHLDDEGISYMFAFMGLVAALIQGGLIGFFSRRFGEIRILRGGILLMALGLGLIPFAPVWALYTLELALVAIGAFGQSLVVPAANSIVSQLADPHEQGRILGQMQSVGALARIFGPILGGALYGVLYYMPYVTCAFFLLLTFLMALRISLPDRKASPSPAAEIETPLPQEA